MGVEVKKDDAHTVLVKLSYASFVGLSVRIIPNKICAVRSTVDYSKHYFTEMTTDYSRLVYLV